MQAEEASQDERREKAVKMKDAAAPGSGGSFGCQAQAGTARIGQFSLPEAMRLPSVSSYKHPYKDSLSGSDLDLVA